jgi:hypothetical protein
MILVVFGAGASYDSVPSRTVAGTVFRPPPRGSKLSSDQRIEAIAPSKTATHNETLHEHG